MAPSWCRKPLKLLSLAWNVLLKLFCLVSPPDHRTAHRPVWSVWARQSECWEHTAQSVLQRDNACQWKRNTLNKEWRQAEGWILLECWSIIWPTCDHMCMTRAGSGSRAQGRAAPATWSSALWFEIRRRDADAQKSTWEGVCVCVCVWPWVQALGMTWGLDKEERKRNFIFCISDITRRWDNKTLKHKEKATLEVVYVQGQNELTGLQSLDFCCFGIHPLTVYLGDGGQGFCTKALCLAIFTPSSPLKQACFCWTTIITARQLTQTDLSELTHYWKSAPMLFVVMNHTHRKSAPWPWYQIIVLLWCCSQYLVDLWQAEDFCALI